MPLDGDGPKANFGSLLLRPIISSKIGDFSKMETQELDALRATEGDRSSRRVDKIDGEHSEGLPSIEGWWAVVATMASMAPMVWLAQGSTDVEVPLVLAMWWRRVATKGDEWWRRWVIGTSTQRALTWKSLCVPSGDEALTGAGWFFFWTESRLSVVFVLVS